MFDIGFPREKKKKKRISIEFDEKEKKKSKNKLGAIGKKSTSFFVGMRMSKSLSMFRIVIRTRVSITTIFFH